MDKFILNTIDPNTFVITDVLDDNACFYRAVANTIQLYYNKDDYNITEWGYDGNKQDLSARLLQTKIVEWICINKDLLIPELNTTVESLVYSTHAMSIEEYNTIYNTFAGDENADLDHDRWGGLIEQVAVCYIYKIPMHVYTPVRLLKTCKKVTGIIRKNKADNGVRLQLLQIIGEEFIKKPAIHILWKNSKTGGHYYSLATA